MEYSRKTVLSSITVIALCFQATFLLAQTKEIDSLTRLVAATKDQRQKANLHYQLGEQLFSYDFEKGLVQANLSLQSAEKTGITRDIAQALTLIGSYHYYKGEHPAAIRYFRQAISTVGEEKSSDYPAKTFLRLSILYRTQADFDSSKWYLRQAENLLQNDKEGALYASMLASRGIVENALHDNENALIDLRKSLVLRLKLNDSSRIADTWRNIGTVYRDLSVYDSATYYYDKAQHTADHIHDPDIQMILSLNKGDVGFLQGDFDKAVDNYTVSLNMLKTNSYKGYYAITLFKIGEVYEVEGSYHTAYEYFYNALKEFEKIDAKQDIAKTYLQIAWCYNYQENYASALENANKGLAIATKINDPFVIAQANNLMGNTLYRTKKYKESLIALERALEIRKKINHQWGVSFTQYNIALLYLELGKTQLAYNMFRQSLAIDERIGKKMGIVFTCNSMGLQYVKEKNYAEASRYLNRANMLAKEIPMNAELMQNYKNFIALHEAQHNSAKAIEYYKLYIKLKDSLSNDLSAGRIAKADALFQLQKKTTEIELARKENELHQEKILLQDAEITFQQWIIITTSICVLLLTILVILVYRLLQANRRSREALSLKNEAIAAQHKEIEAQAEKLKVAYAKLENANNFLEKSVEERASQLHKAYHELENFFYHTSHDFKRPLTTFLGLAELAKMTTTDPVALDLFDKVRATTFSLDSMLIKLQSISSIDNDDPAIEINLTELLQELNLKFKDQLRAKHIDLTMEVSAEKFFANRALVKVILENIIENAIIFSSDEEPYIQIHAREASGKVVVVIHDNGQGIPEELHVKVFEMYYRGNALSKGNGLGLYIAKRAAEKLNGTITLTSTLHEGSSFTVELPLN